MWNPFGCFVRFLTLFMLVWPRMFVHVSAELPLRISNIAFSTEPFNSKNGLTIEATVVTKELQTRLNDSMFFLNYTFSGCTRPAGLQLCSLRFRDQFPKTRHAFLQCTLTEFKVCQEDLLYFCSLEAFIVGRNKTGAFLKSDDLESDIFYSVPQLPVRWLSPSEVSSSWVKLQWTQPDCPKMPYEYFIESYRDGTLQKHSKYNGRTLRQVVLKVQDLKPYTNYSFCVSAKPNIRILGWSSKKCIHAKTREGVSLAVPVIEHIKPISTGKDMGKAVVYWRVNSLEKLNGKLRKFVILYAMKKDLNDWKNKSVPAATGTGLMHYTLTELFVDEEYALKVLLVTGGDTVSSQVKNINFATEIPVAREGNIMKNPVILGVIAAAVMLLIIFVSIVVLHTRKRSTTESITSLIGEGRGPPDSGNDAYERPVTFAGQGVVDPRSGPHGSPEFCPGQGQDNVYDTIEDIRGSPREDCPDNEIRESDQVRFTNGEVHRGAFDPLPDEPSEDAIPNDCEQVTVGSEVYPLMTGVHVEVPMGNEIPFV